MLTVRKHDLSFEIQMEDMHTPPNWASLKAMGEWGEGEGDGVGDWGEGGGHLFALR